MKKINFECLMQIVILLIMTGMLITALLMDAMKHYIHPRTNKYLWFSAAALLAIALSMLPALFRPKRKVNCFSCVILLIPIITGTIIPMTSIQREYLRENDQLNSSQKTSGKHNSLNAYKNLNKRNPEKYNSDNHISVINDEEYLEWFMKVSNNPNAYRGENIKVKGCVYKQEEFNLNEFALVRMAMSCCAADLAPVGFLCKSNRAREFKNGEWIYITAEIKTEYVQHMKSKLPVLYAKDIIRTEKPEVEYVYP